MRGERRTQPGQVVYGYTGQPPKGIVSRADRRRMLDTLAAAPEGERDGVRVFLREDGSEKAIELLAELEERWAGQHT